MTSEELLASLELLLKSLDDVGTELWQVGEHDVEQAYLPYEYFDGLGSAQQVVARAAAGEAPVGLGVALGEPGDLPAALLIRLDPERLVARVQLAIVVASGGQPHWLVVRFESPEGWWHADGENWVGVGEAAEEGEHDYHHVQISPGLKDANLDVHASTAPEWLPASRLAPPVPATDPLDLVLCALISIRHPRFVRGAATRCGEEVLASFDRIMAGGGAWADPGSH